MLHVLDPLVEGRSPPPSDGPASLFQAVALRVRHPKGAMTFAAALVRVARRAARAPSAPAAARVRWAWSLPTGRKLADVAKLELLEQEPPERVAEIWAERHAGSDAAGTVGAVLGGATWAQALAPRLAKHPLFVLPLAKPTEASPFAHLSVLVQAQLPFVALTPLAEYQAKGAAAAPALVATHFTELVDSHGLVLVRGDVTAGNGDIADEDAAALLALTHDFYADDDKYALVTRFHADPDAFRYSAVLRAAGLIKAAALEAAREHEEQNKTPPTRQ